MQGRSGRPKPPASTGCNDRTCANSNMNTVIVLILGISSAFLAVGAFALIALFFACDRAAESEKSKHHENDPR